MKQLMNQAGGLFTAVVLAAFCITAPLTATAQDKAKPATPAAEDAGNEKKPRPYPFNGTVHAVDKQAKTVTLLGKEKSRILHYNDTAKVQKMGKPAKMEDLVAGEEVGGQVTKTDDGKEMIVSLRIGPKAEPEKKPAKEQQPPAKK